MSKTADKTNRNYNQSHFKIKRTNRHTGFKRSCWLWPFSNIIRSDIIIIENQRILVVVVVVLEWVIVVVVVVVVVAKVVSQVLIIVLLGE